MATQASIDGVNCELGGDSRALRTGVMEADKITATETRVPLAAVPVAAAQERVFWIGLACASVLHAALLFEASRSASSRQMGEKGGRPDGISVELIDAADLKAKNSFAEAGAPKGDDAPARKAADESKADKGEQKKQAEQKPRGAEAS